MRALIFDNNLFYGSDYPIPKIRSGEALVKITYAGICSTDIEITKGYMNFRGIPGHEFIGIVKESDKSEIIGKRVVGEINIPCGKCIYCNNGIGNHCPDRSVLGILNKDGVFSEYITLPITNLHLIPDSITDLEAVFVEPLAAAFEIIEQTGINSDSNVCSLGDGKLGLLVAQVLSLTGCKLIVVGRHEEKLSILKKKGIETRLTPDIKNRFDIVVDCSGSSAGIETALNIVRPRGKVVIKTTVAERRSIDLNRIVIDEIDLIGSRCGPFKQAIKALEEKSIDVNPIISKIFRLENGIEALAYASRRGILKVILEVG